MSDIFREVDEDVRREQFERLWKRYGGVVIAIALVIVVATGGYRAWNWYQAREAAAQGELYFAALAEAKEGANAEAAEAFANIAADGGAYASLAKLRSAAALVAADKEAEALQAYEAIAADSSMDANLRDVASVRAAYLALESESVDAMKVRLSSVLAESNPFRHSAREIMAYAALRGADVPAAAEWAEQALADPGIPNNQRQRLDLLLSTIASQRAANAEK